MKSFFSIYNQIQSNPVKSSPSETINKSDSDWKVVHYKTRNGFVYATVLWNQKTNTTRPLDLKI